MARKIKALWLVVLMLVVLWVVSGAVAAPTRQADLAVITTPATDEAVRGQVQIVGSADHPSFSFYIVEVSATGGDPWQFVGDGSQRVVGGVLSTWNTTAFPDGNYTLRLRVVRADGNYSEAFVQQVTVANDQPTPTPTLEPEEEEEASQNEPPPTSSIPTFTPTPLPPTPTVLIDQPVVATETPRPAIPTSPPLQDPDDEFSLVPVVTNFSVSPLRNACIYGASVMLIVFLMFGFLTALRTFITGFLQGPK